MQFKARRSQEGPPYAVVPTVRCPEDEVIDVT